jgi:hypothetical protein
MPSVVTPNDQPGLGQGYNQPVEKYDSEHGKYDHNVPADPPNLPNANPAGPDPSPFRVGGQ